jgi:catechol-2,3-dioxygenase
MPSPARFAHYVLRTNRLEELTRWYCTLLDAHVVFTDGKLTFITYDQEHHRLALVAAETYADKPAETQVGFFHAAFAYESLGALLDNFDRVRRIGIEPVRCINHGPTLSFYYRDPDRNDVELQVDAFATSEEATAFMQGEHFARNPIGVLLDPDELLLSHRGGAPDATLLQRPDTI